MQFPSNNAASVHPAVWRAMQAAERPDVPYDGDGLSRWLDNAFSALSLGFVKNGGMGAAAIAFFAPEQGDVVRYRRKRAGHPQSKDRFLAAQILGLLDGGLWLANACAANAAPTEIAGAAGERLLHPVEAHELFVRLTPAERAALRAQGFAVYDWDDGAARFVTAWNSDPAHGTALVRATAGL